MSRAAAAVLLAAAAALGALSTQGPVERELRVRAGNAPINPGATDPRDLRLHNSPTLVRSPADPRLLAVTSRVDGPSYSCALHVSRDAGSTWREVSVPLPEGEEPKCYAPDAVFDAGGTLLVSFVTLAGRGNVPHAGWVARLPRGSAALTPPVRVSGPLAFQVRLAAHPRRPGHVWLTWLQAADVAVFRFGSTGNPIVAAASTDGGRTWSEPARVSAGSRRRVVAPSPAASAGGTLFVLYLDLEADRLDYEGGHEGQGGPPYPGTWTLVLARSRDGGRTWEERPIDGDLKPVARFVPFIPAFPSLAVDPDGERLYAAYHDARAGDPDVWLWRSADGGASWSPPERVNDTPPDDGTAQYLPRLALADERLDVVYLDRRADPRNVLNEVSMQSAAADGRFGPRLRLSDRAFDSRIGDGRERNMPDLGSRLALLSTPSEALAVWPDTRAGASIPRQDLARALVAVESRRRSRRWMLLAGAGLGTLGGLALGSSLARRRLTA